MKIENGKVYTMILCFALGFLYSSITQAIVRDLTWMAGANVNPVQMLKHYVSNYFPYHLFGLVLLSSWKHSRWKKIFSWKLWVFPSLGFTVFCLTQWQFNPVLNYQTKVFGLDFNWQWAAMLEWNILFIVQLWLYQKNGMDKVFAFALSFCGVFLGGVLYEIPWYIHNAKWSYLCATRNIFVASVFPAILYYAKWKFNRFLLLGLLPLLIFWPLFYQWPRGSYWLPRLSTFPLFVMIPLTFKKKA